MTKNIVVCLDGTNNKLRSASNTNVVRLLNLLDLSDPTRQIAYYDPGVGTFSSPGAWTPLARNVSRYAGLLFGAGLRQNLGEAYTYLLANYEPGDRIYLFGFSRGAYNARALSGMLDVFGVFRRGCDSLVPYAVNAFTRPQRHDHDEETREYFKELRVYAQTHAIDRRGHQPIHFVGLWDTVKSAGTLTRQLRWPFTRQLPHATTIRHAVAIDESRRPYPPYLITKPDPEHLMVESQQDLQQVWFAGVHSDVGGVFPTGTRLSDIPLKWMADEAAKAGLIMRPKVFATMSQLKGVDPTGPTHNMGWWWKLLGPGVRTVPSDALIHSSVSDRVAAHPGYARRLPSTPNYVCPDWRTPLALPPRQP